MQGSGPGLGFLASVPGLFLGRQPGTYHLLLKKDAEEEPSSFEAL